MPWQSFLLLSFASLLHLFMIYLLRINLISNTSRTYKPCLHKIPNVSNFLQLQDRVSSNGFHLTSYFPYWLKTPTTKICVWLTLRFRMESAITSLTSVWNILNNVGVYTVATWSSIEKILKFNLGNLCLELYFTSYSLYRFWLTTLSK